MFRSSPLWKALLCRSAFPGRQGIRRPAIPDEAPARPNSNSMPPIRALGGTRSPHGWPLARFATDAARVPPGHGLPPLRKPRLRSFRGICPNVPLPAWGRFFGELVTTFYYPPEDKNNG